MFVELHIIQNFAPSNLNRDDTNAPKDCVFGGYRRARISSQCLKRAARQQFKNAKLIDDSDLAVRTKRLVEEVVQRLEEGRKKEERAAEIVKSVLAGMKLKVVDDGKTEYLLYLGSREIDRIAALCETHWDTLIEALDSAADGGAASGKKKGSKEAKRAAKETVPPAVTKELEAIFATTTALDLALFGRMLADSPENNIDAATQVAHAISTNEVNMEMDFYTAVDDLRPGDTQGADMMGVVEFNSSCFYRYAQVNLGVLEKTLGGNRAAAVKAIEAFLRASIGAVPTGKQNSMAAQNPPLYVRVLVRESGQPWNLANAFLKPVRVGRNGADDIGELSVGALERHLAAIERMHGKDGIKLNAASSLYDEKSQTVPALVESVAEALS